MQSFPTVLIPFRESFALAVETELNQFGNPPVPSVKRALDRLRTIHFMSISVVRMGDPARVGAGAEDAFLVLEVSADGDARMALTQVATALRDPLRNLLQAAGLDEAADLPSLLIKHEQAIGPGWLSPRLGLCFAGTPGMSVHRIRREAALAWRILRMGDELAADTSALEKLQQVREKLWGRGDKWAFGSEPMPYLDTKRSGRVGAAAQVGPAIAWTLLWPLLLVVLPVLALAWLWQWWAALLVFLLTVGALVGYLLYLRRLEKRDVPNDTAPDADHVRDVMDRENFYPKNLLVNVTEMKPGWLRRLALRAAFLAIGQLAAKKFRPGLLANLGTIHFARWMLLPGAQSRLVFLSNYDGALESYLEDFVQMAPQGVTGIWSNTVGFMRSRWLFTDGAVDGDRLRRFVLRHQQPARFWYCGYPSLTTTRIRANAAICRGIAAANTEEAAQAWLACFGASGPIGPAEVPAAARPGLFSHLSRKLSEARHIPRTPLNERSIPMLAFEVRNNLPHAECLMVRLKADPARCRDWLNGLSKEVTFGPDGDRRGRRLECALSLAFTASAFGPDKLALPPGDLATFSPPFLNGMDADCRARALGDEGLNAPDDWEWGGRSNRADVLLVAYDLDQIALRQRIAELKRGARQCGHTIAYSLPLEPPSKIPAPGPFGFVDGVSQPSIRGTSGKLAPGAEEPPLDAGEFILGYRDTSGYLPPSPKIAAQRDLGRDGTYLVVRQLEQHSEGFADWLKATATRLETGTTCLAKVPAGALSNVLAAKSMGRWYNGSALAQNPGNPGVNPRNDFRYGRLDPSGSGCPLGSHARRANPRDSLNPGSNQQLKVTNRHRILRVGRKYAPTAPDGRAGLLFMCINADIGRQFEFIQQTWLLGRSFLGLEEETDPIIGVGRHETRRFTVQTSNGPIRLRIPKLLHRTRGGAYFFMPGREALHYLAQDHTRPAAAASTLRLVVPPIRSEPPGIARLAEADAATGNAAD